MKNMRLGEVQHYLHMLFLSVRGKPRDNTAKKRSFSLSKRKVISLTRVNKQLRIYFYHCHNLGKRLRREGTLVQTAKRDNVRSLLVSASVVYRALQHSARHTSPISSDIISKF